MVEYETQFTGMLPAKKWSFNLSYFYKKIIRKKKIERVLFLLLLLNTHKNIYPREFNISHSPASPKSFNFYPFKVFFYSPSFINLRFSLKTLIPNLQSSYDAHNLIENIDSYTTRLPNTLPCSPPPFNVTLKENVINIREYYNSFLQNDTHSHTHRVIRKIGFYIERRSWNLPFFRGKGRNKEKWIFNTEME